MEGVPFSIKKYYLIRNIEIPKSVKRNAVMCPCELTKYIVMCSIWSNVEVNYRSMASYYIEHYCGPVLRFLI